MTYPSDERDPAAAIAHVERDPCVSGVQEDRDLLDARVPRGVRHRLASREHERLRALVERCITGAHDVDAHAVQLLDLRCRRFDRACERPLRSRCAVGIEPRAELALLPACEAPGVGRILLDQRQRLEDGVVHPRSEVCTLTLPCEAPGPRTEHEQERHSDRARCEQRRRGAARVVPDEDDDSDDDQHDRRQTCGPLREPERASTQQHDPCGNERERPDERVGQAEPPEREDAGPDEEQHPGDPSPGPRPRAVR
jgi:hypothetical protein